MEKYILEVKDIFKSYKDIHALNGVSFNVKEGELFSLLGVNGAGKSTLINIIGSYFERDSGSIKINELDFDKDRNNIKSMISIVFQESILDDKLSVYDNLLYRSSLYKISKKDFIIKYNELDKMLGLNELKDRIYGRLSGGQRRRVDIARGLLNSPKLLILDEPTTGLDPLSRKRIWDAIKLLQKENNMSVFLTTHYMEEADESDHVVIIDNGHKIDEGTPNELKNKYSGVYLKVYINQNNEIDELLNNEKLTYNYDIDHYKIKFKSIDEINNFLDKKPTFRRDFEIIKGNMDDVFINATGKKLRE